MLLSRGNEILKLVNVNRVSTILISAIAIVVILLVSFVGIPALNLMLKTELPPVSGDDLLDSDGDGVPDELEINGYYFKDGEFRLWDGDPNITYYRTDPTQPSTDQDPYSDGMEVSGVKMDTSVASPGNHPLVPAYPDIYVSMFGFDVVSKSEITNSKGGQAQNAWSNSVTDETTKEGWWSISSTFAVEKKWGGTDVGGKVSASLTIAGGQKYGTKHSVTDSTSGFSSEDWKEATTVNPAEAAKIILRVRFENRGTATAQNIIPTVNVMLGDKTINTYEMQEDKTIDTLAINQIFPATSDWVVGDKPKTLAGMQEILLTMDELKSIQLGVPIFLDIPQLDADVLAQNEEGHWEVVDTWQHYQARIDGVCARISVDLGDGNMKDYKVFASSANGPVVTLREALEWTVGCEETANGLEIMGLPVGNWRIGFSQNSIDDVGMQLAESDILDLVLDAGWTITIKAPTGLDTPELVWCESYQQGENTLVKAAVIDDFGVSEVKFMTTPEAAGQEMETDWAGTGVYSLELPSEYKVTGEEIIKATNDRNNSVTKPVEVPTKAPIANGIYVINSVNSNKVLTIDGTVPKNETNVVQYNFAGIDSQKWKVQHVGNGYYEISDITSGMCLEVVEGRTDDEANVQINTWQNTDSQKWRLEPADTGTYRIKARHSNKCLDIDRSSQANGASAMQNAGSDSDSQEWILQIASSYPAVMPVRGTLEERFVILNKESNECLQVDDIGTDEGDGVGQHSWVSGDYQMWELIPVGDGYFRICASHSGLSLTMENNILTQESYLGAANQKWRIKWHEAVQTYPSDFYFYYEIENKDSHMVLTSNESDDEVIQQNYLGKASQKWQLLPIESYSWNNTIMVTNTGSSSKAVPLGEDWTLTGCDLNLGCGSDSDYLWLWVRGPNTYNIRVTNTGKSSTALPPDGEGWTQIGGDLNLGCNTAEIDSYYVWLWVRGPATDNIWITNYGGSHPSQDGKGEGWTLFRNLNEGCENYNYVYLWIR
jgi:protective antigen